MTTRPDLDVALAAVRTEIDWPATPRLRAAVVERVAAAPPARRFLARWPQALVVAMIATLILAAAVAAAVLLLPGLRLSFVPAVPTAAPGDPLAARLALGTRVDAAPAGSTAVPGELGPPDEIYVAQGGDVVSLVYAAGERLPELFDSGIGLLVQDIRGSLSRERVEKLVSEVGATVTPVLIGGAEGFWIDGPPHLVRYRDVHGAERSEMTRLVGRTLVWQRGGSLIRIESGLSLEATLAIAESIGR
jgi:hypothetical protein